MTLPYFIVGCPSALKLAKHSIIQGSCPMEPYLYQATASVMGSASSQMKGIPVAKEVNVKHTLRA